MGMEMGMDVRVRPRPRPRPRPMRTTTRAFVAVSVMVAFATTACVGGRASVDDDDASSSSSSSSFESSFESSSSFVRALDVETLRDDVIARSRDPWVISFSGSRERCGMCGTAVGTAPPCHPLYKRARRLVEWVRDWSERVNSMGSSFDCLLLPR